MHAHFGDPLILEVEYFYKLGQNRVGTSIVEGYRIYDLDKETEVYDINGKLLGRVQVISTTQTKISFLKERDIKASGYKSKEFLTRDLLFRYNKSRIDWITIVKFFPKVKFVNRS